MNSRLWKLIAAFPLAAALPFCHLSCSSDEGSKCSDQGSVFAQFDLSSQDRVIPFPSDIFTKADPAARTGLRLNMGENNSTLIDAGLDVTNSKEALIDDLNRLDGFGSFTPVLVGLSGKTDESTLPASPAESASKDSSVFIASLDTQEIEFIPVRVSFGSGAAEKDGPPWYLLIKPFMPMKPQTKYAVVVKTGVKAEDGKPLGSSADFMAVKGKCEAGGASKDEVLRLRQETADLFETLDLNADEVAIAFTFTTQSFADEMLAVHEYIAQLDPPEANFDPDGDGQPNVYATADFPDLDKELDLAQVAAMAKGSFEAPDFRHAEEGFKFDESGTPVEASRQQILFLLAIPAGEGPFPVVIFQHGFGCEKEWMLKIAEPLAERGIAAIAIDAIGHGDRENEAFIDTGNVGRMRDNFRQAAADLMRLADLVKSFGSLDLLPLGAPDGAPDLKIDRLGYIGNSMGSFIGAAFMALEEDAGAAVLNVGGAGFADFFENYFGRLMPKAKAFAALQFMSITQTIMDRADPINYGVHLMEEPFSHVGQPKQVLLQEAIQDQLLPTYTVENLARAAGLPLVRPYVQQVVGIEVVDAPAEGGGLFQFDQSKHGFLLLQDDGPQTYAAGRRQVGEFFASFFSDGSALIIDPF